MDLANPIWRQIVADVLNRPLCLGTGEQASERAGVGAAMIAGIGTGVFGGYQDTQKLAPIFNVVTEPKRDTVALYESHYRSFLEIYPRLSLKVESRWYQAVMRQKAGRIAAAGRKEAGSDLSTRRYVAKPDMVRRPIVNLSLSINL
jgi:ribulose kinase